MRLTTCLIPTAALVMLVSLTGCDALVNGSNAAAGVTGKAFSDAGDTWSDVFTYHGKVTPLMPQTRYCYKNMDDVVCYDSVQPTLTAKMVGFQDGNHQSWIQPGGGSLGASGGAPEAFPGGNPGAAAKQRDVIAARTPIEAEAVGVVNKNGEIQSLDLPPAR